MTGLLKVIEMLGSTIAALEQENIRLKATIDVLSKRQTDPMANGQVSPEPADSIPV